MKRPSLFLLVLAILTACSKNKPKNVEPVTNIFYDKAFEFRNSNLKDSAFFYFDRARDMFIKQKDSLGIGKCLVNMAIISTDNGDYTGGQKASIDAISFFNEKNKKQHPYITSNYNNLGVATYSQAKYLQAIKFYDLAIKFTKNPDDISLYLNNKATAYQELKQYGQALTIFNQILKSATKDSLKYAMVLNNIAFTKFLENPAYDADPDLLRALQIRENANDLFGKNSSYATLADYYAKENPALALSFAQKMYRVAKKTNIANDKLQALQKLIRLSPAGETKQYFELYNKLDDSVEVARGTTENRFVLAKYEYEKNKSDNLTLLKFKAENRLIFYGLLLIFGLIVSYTIFWYQRRKQKIALETQNAIRESRLKTSKKVHDVVANGLYRVMTEIEHTEGLDKEEMLDRLDEMYQKSRDISYEVEEPNPMFHNFSQQITALLQAFITPTTKVTIKGNTNELWSRVNAQAKHEIEHVLQELMVNMKKHSHATEVDLSFKQSADHIRISYIDNGVGMAKDAPYKNGIRNTGNRIEHIMGEITFDTKLEKGLKILIVFPIV